MSITDPNQVLLIAEGTEVERGGQERSILELARGLREAGKQISWAALDDVEGEWPTHRIAVRSGFRGARTREFLKEAEQLARERRSEVCVLSFVPLQAAHLYFPRGGVFPEAFARSAAARGNPLSRRVAQWGAKFDSRRRILAAAERGALTAPDGPILLALSNYVAESARRHYGILGPRVRVVRNGVDLARMNRGERVTDVRAKWGIPEDAVILMTVAHNPRLKGIPELIRAAETLPDDANWHLLVVGRADSLTSANPRIRFLGVREDVAALLYGDADVLVHPTHYDPSSRVVLEALAVGCPVITTRWNGAAEDVGRAGIVVDDPRDTTDLAAALRQACRAEWRTPARVHAQRAGLAVGQGRQVAGVLAAIAEVSR